MTRNLLIGALIVINGLAAAPPQASGTAGTISGKVTDPSGAAVPKATVAIVNKLTNYKQEAATDSSGLFRLVNVPPGQHHLQVSAAGFAPAEQDVDVRGSVPVDLKIPLAIGANTQSVTVESSDLLENVPYAHNDVDLASMNKLPTSSPGAGLSDAIVLSSGALAKDSNGFFHPLGDHAQTSFSVDTQPISDQQSKNFSTQLPLNAIQSMELITGAPPPNSETKPASSSMHRPAPGWGKN